MTRFTAEVEDVLRRAGWVPNRRVDIGGPGITCAREPFEFDPDLAIGEEERFADLSDKYGRRLFPVGDVGQGEFFLAIDEQSVVYLAAAAVLRHGTVDLALEQLITGVAPEKVSPPPTVTFS